MPPLTYQLVCPFTGPCSKDTCAIAFATCYAPCTAFGPAVVYDYAQSLEEVLVEAQLPAHIQQGDIHVKLTPSTLLVVVGRQRLVDGRLAGLVDPEHSSWKIGGCLVVVSWALPGAPFLQ